MQTERESFISSAPIVISPNYWDLPAGRIVRGCKTRASRSWQPNGRAHPHQVLGEGRLFPFEIFAGVQESSHRGVCPLQGYGCPRWQEAHCCSACRNGDGRASILDSTFFGFFAHTASLIFLFLAMVVPIYLVLIMKSKNRSGLFPPWPVVRK